VYDPSVLNPIVTTSPVAGPSSTELAPQQPHRYLKLPHPRTGALNLYLVRDEEAKILEIQAINPERKRSWFYGDEIISGEWLALIFAASPKTLAYD
jgi:hypothetical protein